MSRASRASFSPAARAGAWARSTKGSCRCGEGRWCSTCSTAFARRSTKSSSTPTSIAPSTNPVLSDAIGGFAGPLAGLQVGLSRASFPLIATVPCDSPFLPGDLVARLASALIERNADLAVARTFDQPHPVFALVRRSVLPHLTRFLEEGGRKIDAWYASLDTIEVAFDDEADAFRNINTRDELKEADTAAQR